MLNWTFTVQRELKGRFLVEAGYSALIGTHLIANLLNYNQINISTLPPSLNIFTNAGRNLLNTTFDNGNKQVQNAGFSKPYAEFPDNLTLARALKPFPQFNNITTSSGGDHSGHSSYHSMILKVTRRFANDLMVDGSYVFSKMFTDSDSSWGNSGCIGSFQSPVGQGSLGL